MLENVSGSLRRGGFFIGTIPDAEKLLSRLQDIPDAKPLRFGNSVYHVQFKQRSHIGMYGHEYRFRLVDAADVVAEYLVHWENFESYVSSVLGLLPLHIAIGPH